MPKMTVRKRHGVWLAIDHTGRIRIAGDAWWPVLTYAILSRYDQPPPNRWSAYLPPFHFREWLGGDDYGDPL